MLVKCFNIVFLNECYYIIMHWSFLLFLQVPFDFKLMFENVNDSGLLSKWALIKNIPYTQYGIRLEKAEHPVTRKSDDIYKMFMYLKLIPTPRYSFKKSVNSFLTYTEVVQSAIHFTCVFIIIYKCNSRIRMMTQWIYEIPSWKIPTSLRYFPRCHPKYRITLMFRMVYFL